jgi:hypothetical protein
MATKRIATTALDWGVLAAKIPAENKVRKHNHVCGTPPCFKGHSSVSRAVLWISFGYGAEHCFTCRPSDSTVSEDAGIKPRTVATITVTVTDFDIGSLTL